MSLGYPSVTSIVWQNIRIDQGAIDATIIAEVELVNYSDKRVKHEEVVGLKESFRDIHERYKGKIPGLEEVLKETFFIEEKFFSSSISAQRILQILSSTNHRHKNFPSGIFQGT